MSRRFVSGMMSEYTDQHVTCTCSQPADTLDLGGNAYAPGNLWPESYPGTGGHVKDQVEKRLNDLVCGRQLGLGVTQ